MKAAISKDGILEMAGCGGGCLIMARKLLVIWRSGHNCVL